MVGLHAHTRLFPRLKHTAAEIAGLTCLGEPVDDRFGDLDADAADLGELVDARVRHRVERAEPLGDQASGRGAQPANRQRHEHTVEVGVLGLVDFGEHLACVLRGSHIDGTSVAFLHAHDHGVAGHRLVFALFDRVRPERRHLMPQARPTDATARPVCLARLIHMFTHLDNRRLTPHLHVFEVVCRQREHTRFARQHRLLRFGQFQPFRRHIRLGFVARRHEEFTDARRIRLDGIRPVLFGVRERHRARLPQMLDIERLA